VGAHPALTVSRVRRGITIVTGAALAGAFIAYGGAASATPNPTASQVRAKISKLMSQLDAVSQQYDQSITDLNAATARLKVINQTLSRDRQNLGAMRTAVAQIASAAYEQGNLNSASAILTSDDPQTILDQASLLNHLSSDRRAQLSAYLNAARAVQQSAQQQARTTAAVAQLEKSKQAQHDSLKKLIAKNQAELAKLTAPSQSPSPSPSTTGTGGSGSGGAGTGGSGSGGGITYKGPATGAARIAVSFALSQIGAPYAWGGTGPYSAGYDCSGLVMVAWAQAGVQIPRTTYDDWASLPHVATADMQPGDLMLFDSEGHVGMYVGNGMLVDAPQPGQTVEEIPITTSWYAQTFDGAVRP
jgi:cell wall-associated NlpC family hydrolase